MLPSQCMIVGTISWTVVIWNEMISQLPCIFDMCTINMSESIKLSFGNCKLNNSIAFCQRNSGDNSILLNIRNNFPQTKVSIRIGDVITVAETIAAFYKPTNPCVCLFEWSIMQNLLVSWNSRSRERERNKIPLIHEHRYWYRYRASDQSLI